jgi:flagellar basal body-associated protein FliL
MADDEPTSLPTLDYARPAPPKPDRSAAVLSAIMVVVGIVLAVIIIAGFFWFMSSMDHSAR